MTGSVLVLISLPTSFIPDWRLSTYDMRLSEDRRWCSFVVVRTPTPNTVSRAARRDEV